MKPTSTLAALAALTLATGSALAGVAPMPAPVTPAPAPAPAGGPYLDISAGPLWISDISSIGFDTGWGINGEIGYALGNGFSFGLSTGYNTADLDVEGLDLPGDVDLDSKLETVPIMLTANYSFPIAGALSGYIGLGAGVLWASGEASVSVHGKTYGAEVDDWNWALQGRAGLSYALSSTAAINVGYRYLHGFFSEDQYQGQMVEGGVTIRF